MAPWLKTDAIRNDVTRDAICGQGRINATPTKTRDTVCGPYKTVGAPFMAPWLRAGAIRNDITRDTVCGQGRINATPAIIVVFLRQITL